MERIVKFEGIEVGLKASAGTVRAYRDMYGRDIINDMGELEEAILKKMTMDVEASRICENVIYLMAKEYNPDIPDINEWLGQFSPYFVYRVVPEVIAMWRINSGTMNKSKKN